MREASAVVGVERAAAVRARVDVQLQRPVGHLFRALHQRLARDDGAGAHEHRQHLQRGRDRQQPQARTGIIGWIARSRPALDGDHRLRRVCHAQAGPVVVPVSRRQQHGIRRRLLPLRRRRHQQVRAPHELRRRCVVQRPLPVRVGELQEHRPHHRDPLARRLLRHRVDVGQQPVARLDRRPADRLVPAPVHPRLLRRRVLVGVVAAERVEHAELQPARQQLRRGRAHEAAEVDAAERHPGQAEAEQHRRAQPQVGPGRGVVAGPGDGITLRAGIGGAGHHERALLGAEPEQPVMRGADVEHAVHVVDLGLRRHARGEAGLVDPTLDVERDRPGRGVEHRGLVHVVPEPGGARLAERPVQLAPPPARAGAGEVREHAGSWPYRPHVKAAIRIVQEVAAGPAAVVRLIGAVRLHRHVHVGDQHGVELLLPQLGQQPGQVWKAVGVGGERFVAVLVVDVEPQHVGRDALPAEGSSDGAQRVRAHVAVARLLVSERPGRRQRRVPGQPCVATQHLLGRRAVQHHVVERTAGGLDAQLVFLGVANVEAGAPAVVQKQPVGGAAAQAQKKRDRLVERVAAALEAVGIGVPQGEAVAAPVDRPSPIAQPEHVLVRVQVPVHGEAVACECWTDAGPIGRDDASVKRADRHRAAAPVDTDAKGGGVEADHPSATHRQYGHTRRARARQHRPGRVFRKGSGGGRAYPDHVVVECRDVQQPAPHPERHAAMLERASARRCPDEPGCQKGSRRPSCERDAVARSQPGENGGSAQAASPGRWRLRRLGAVDAVVRGDGRSRDRSISCKGRLRLSRRR